MTNTLFLFDLDGVLVYPGGYKEALRATIDRFAVQMGQPPINLTIDEIAEFEACGITNEWDSSLMCVAATLVDVLLQRPDLAGKDIEGTLQTIRNAGVSIERPDFALLAREVAALAPHDAPPTEAIDQIIRQRARGGFGAVLDGLLSDIYSLQTPTTRTLQHFTLGSKRYHQTYGLKAEFDTESMLIAHDKPLLSQEMIDRLRKRVRPHQPGMAIYTARPSLPPSGASLSDGQGNYPPEANLAADLLGLADCAPLIASGAMTWLAAQRGKMPADYIKPSPVQALAAIGAAHSGEIIGALEAAARLAEDDRLSGPLGLLAKEPARVVVFEDSCGGIQATQRAVELLSRAGAPVTCEAVGVAEEATKCQALETVADRVVGDINEGLASYFQS
ncbi:MAG: hypothetical protein JXB30_13425 [Anaerolineae bacterium]|nr:hypothetical protein [Anaerolineae bacterium]